MRSRKVHVNWWAYYFNLGKMVRIKKEWIKLEILKFHACVWPFRCYGFSYGCFLPFSSIFSFRYFALTNSPLCPVLCYFCLKKNEKLLYFCVFYKRKRSVVLTGRIFKLHFWCWTSLKITRLRLLLYKNLI